MEVECRLENGPAYLAGEDVSAKITFRNPPEADFEVNLAWASVQLHCFCTVNHQKVDIYGDKTGKMKELSAEFFGMVRLTVNFTSKQHQLSLSIKPVN